MEGEDDGDEWAGVSEVEGDTNERGGPDGHTREESGDCSENLESILRTSPSVSLLPDLRRKRVKVWRRRDQ
jgi:hypothetical protein